MASVYRLISELLMSILSQVSLLMGAITSFKNSNLFKVIPLFSLLTLLSACSLLTQDKAAESSAQVIPLLSVPAVLQQKVWLEKFTFSLDVNEQQNNEGSQNKVSRYANQSMLLQTELSKQGINIAAMSFDGIPLAQASWNSDSQLVKSELTVAKDFDAKQVLHDLQIVHWPVNLIAPSLFKGFSVDEQIMLDEGNDNKIKVRRFYHQGEVIIIIRYQVKEIHLEQVRAGYQLTITRLNSHNLDIAPKP